MRWAGRWFLWPLTAVLVVAAGMWALPAARAQRLRDVPDDTTVGTVNGEAVTAGELMHELTSRYGQSALQELVLEWIIGEEAARRGVSVRDDEVLRAACDRMSSPDRTPATREELDAAGEADGFDVELLLLDIRYELLLGRVLSDSAEVTEAQLRELYTLQPDTFRSPQAHVRMILFPTEKNAQGLVPTLTAGSLPDYARQMSADEARRESGGDWGWVRLDDLPNVRDLRSFVANAPLGEVSSIIRTPDGWVVAVVEDRKFDAPETFEQARDRVREAAIEQEKAEMYREWQEKARKIAGILSLDGSIGPLAPLPSAEDARRLEETRAKEDGQAAPGP